MSTTSKHHHELTDGSGKCSVPMWSGGLPAGFCNEKAFGERPKGKTWRDPYTGEQRRFDGKFNGYMSGLACPAHGGPDCPGIEVDPGVFSGCDNKNLKLNDCPTCCHD